MGGDKTGGRDKAVREPAAETQSDLSKLGIDKKRLQEQFAAMDARIGFVVDPTATAEKVRAILLAAGVPPEDNEASREIIRLREEQG